MSEDLSGLVRTLVQCSGVKDIERRGWKVRAGVDAPESVADHTFATALAAMMVGDLLGLDTLNLVRMALLHDVCEAITGDVQPGEMELARKEELEMAALGRLLRDLPSPLRRKYLLAFREFNCGATPESVMARDLDRIEMALQAIAYERRGVDGKLLDEFWKTADEKVKSRMGKAILRSAATLRPRNSSPSP